VSAEPNPADPPPAVPRPRDPGESTEPLRLDESAEPLRPGESAEPLPPSDADLIAASRAGDAAAYDTLYRRHVTAAHGLAGQVVRVHTVAWDRTRSAILCVHSAPDHRPAATFSAAGTPYLVGVITAATPLASPASPAFVTPPVPAPGTRALAAAPRSASRPALAVLVVRRLTHEARAALAPGGVTH
jgi:hypothetical protein